MLENFDTLAKRPMVKDYVHKKAAEWVYKLFIDEIKEVEDMFDSQSKRPPPMPISHPKHGGLAIWAQSLIVRIDRAKDVSIFSIFLAFSNIFTSKSTSITFGKRTKAKSKMYGYLVQPVLIGPASTRHTILLLISFKTIINLNFIGNR